MPAEVWFRNPKLYIRECIELGVDLVAWDRGFLTKHRIDPSRFADLYFPSTTDYRLLAIGDQGSAELRRGRGFDKPVAVYPTWVYGDDLRMLEEWLANPMGEDEAACSDRRLASDERPVFGQEHRVVITDVPPASAPAIKQFYKVLAEMQADYPEAIVHVHGLYSFNIAFGNTFRAVDMDPRPLAKIGKVNLPNGRQVRFEDAAKTPQWVEVVGFRLEDLSVPRNRCMYNMRAAQWAAAHYQENLRFRVRGGTNHPVDATSPTALAAVPVTLAKTKSSPVVASLGDKFICDTCSLANTCKYFREGSVCSLPDTDAAKLSRYFNTRNSDQIIDGLAVLMETQAERLAMGRRIEEEDGELVSEVTKIIDGMFSKGVQLAKLINPSLTPKQPLVGIIAGNVAVGNGTPQELAAGAVAALEERGYQRDQITAGLIDDVLSGKPVPPPPLELEAVPDDE